MSLLLIMSIHVIIKHFQKTGIFVRRGTVVNVFHRIQPETVNASVNPSFGCFGNGLVSGRRSGTPNGAVIQIRKPVGHEMRMVMP